MKKRAPLTIIPMVEVIDAGSEGKAVARSGDMVIFIPFAAPGDVVDIQLLRKKKSFAEGRIIKFHHISDKRAEPFCKHFGLCGGCKWQHLKYEEQLHYKQKQVEDNFIRIGKLDVSSIFPIRPSAQTIRYRNKLEFTFSNRKWLTDPDRSDQHLQAEMRGLGFHLPGMFDRILDIQECYLQDEPSNAIRMAVKSYAIDHDLSFYDTRKWTGLLRNLIIRNTTRGDLMVILVFHHQDDQIINALLGHIDKSFPQITSLMFVINPKRNDTITDQQIHLYKGLPYLLETFPAFGSHTTLQFKISPVSFFQTNTMQALELYSIAASFAGPGQQDIVYDLYTGTGTIANFIAGQCRYVVGIDYIPSAIDDARENSRLNKITNTRFFYGDIAEMLTNEFIDIYGSPDIVITDPPRAGMHEKVIRQLISISPGKIVYISCNPATQARDIALLKDFYTIGKVQPVDMFPHTQHVENIVLLEIKK